MTANTIHNHTTISADDTLNALIARHPSTLPVLQRFGLDTCCGGALALRVAAEHHHLDLTQLLTALQSALVEAPQ